MSWQRHKIARVEQLPEMGGLHIAGIEAIRHCGCQAQIGMRMDKRETTFGVTPCDQHGGGTARAMDTFKHMPPQEDEVIELWAHLLESEIGTGV